MFSSKRLLVGILTVLVLIGIGNRAGWAAGKGDPKAGQALFSSNPCGTCHGKDGSGNTTMGKSLKAKDLRSDEVQKQSDEELTTIIAKGKNKMPSYEKLLGPAKIQDLVAYIRTLKSK